MRIFPLNQSAFLRRLSIAVVAGAVLTSGFFYDFWHTAEKTWFLGFQRDNESLVVGRMVKSRSDGIFSAGGLNGAGISHDLLLEWISPEEADRQYTAYFKGQRFDVYTPYRSQNAGQGMVFSLLDRTIPLKPQLRIRFYHLLTSLLSAAALTMVVLWFYGEFGPGAALAVLGSMVFSQWLTVFGRNLWWSLWAFYLPMIAVIHFFRSGRTRAGRRFLALGTLSFVVVFVKCLFNGFEYVSTALLMMTVPLVYYAVLERTKGREVFRGVLAAASGALLALLLSAAVLVCQIGAAGGGSAKGVEHITSSFLKRTYGDARAFPDVYAASLQSSAMTVVSTYLRGVFFDANNFIRVKNHFVSRALFIVRYHFLIVLFLAASLLIVFRPVGDPEVKRRYAALVAATWFSLLAPLSWFLIFKAHSHIHTHMNFIVWQMPFTFFGFAVCGLAGKIMLQGLARTFRNHRM